MFTLIPKQLTAFLRANDNKKHVVFYKVHQITVFSSDVLNIKKAQGIKSDLLCSLHKDPTVMTKWLTYHMALY